MTDLSNTGRLGGTSLWRQLFVDSFGTYLHLAGLVWQAWWTAGDRSRAAELKDGTYVPLHRLFDLDGTTLVIERDDGSIRRIPASRVRRIVDKGDFGYV